MFIGGGAAAEDFNGGAEALPSIPSVLAAITIVATVPRHPWASGGSQDAPLVPVFSLNPSRGVWRRRETPAVNGELRAFVPATASA